MFSCLVRADCFTHWPVIRDSVDAVKDVEDHLRLDGHTYLVDREVGQPCASPISIPEMRQRAVVWSQAGDGVSPVSPPHFDGVSKAELLSVSALRLAHGFAWLPTLSGYV